MSGGKDNISAVSISEGVNRSGGFGSSCVVVHSYLTEVVTEARLHERPRDRIKRAAR